MITPISENKIHTTKRNVINNSTANFSALLNKPLVPDNFKSQVHFTGASTAAINNKSRGILSKVFGYVTKEVLSDGSILKTKFNKKGVKSKEIYSHESGLKTVFYFEEDGKTISRMRKFVDSFILKETYFFDKGKQFLATKYNADNYERFFFGGDKTCVYTKTVTGKKPKEIILNLAKPQEMGTIPDVNMIMPLKEADVFNYKVKSKDLDEFLAKMKSIVQEQEEKSGNKGAGIPYVIEGPRYEGFKNTVKELTYGKWASMNLKNRGYDVALPKGENPNEIMDVYVFKSREFVNEFLSKFVNKDEWIQKDAYKKANKMAQEFSNSVGGADDDVNFKDAADFLFYSEYSKIYEQKFHSFMNNFNVRILNYKMPNPNV